MQSLLGMGSTKTVKWVDAGSAHVMFLFVRAASSSPGFARDSGSLPERAFNSATMLMPPA